MSHCLFIHDFFADGRLDVLAEIRVMQVCGQWTKEKRAAWTKQAKVAYEKARCNYPLGSSYNAGRIAALRSATTAHYPTLDPQFHGKMVFLSIPDKKKVMCLECVDDASWKCHPDGSFDLVFYLCDRCKQEQVRTQAALTTFGWDHDNHELIPLPMPQKLVQMEKAALELSTFVLPSATLLGFDLFNVITPTSHLAVIQELAIVVLVYWQSKDIARFLFSFLYKLIEGKDA